MDGTIVVAPVKKGKRKRRKKVGVERRAESDLVEVEVKRHVLGHMQINIHTLITPARPLFILSNTPSMVFMCLSSTRNSIVNKYPRHEPETSSMECCFKVVSKDGPKTFQDHFKRPIVFGGLLIDLGTKDTGTHYLE
ncbi:unnamed protein product [Sphenostylis stenocarpa]|uniref:Uncharacterized protein n=1 Tax=Sphenostylis stenocarpa TaxID=92480 RepID=A0AA86SKT9_9FABA|nr:unnamed protein product [Sphenostylis stenocarpa]